MNAEDALATLAAYAIVALVFGLIVRALLRYARRTIHPTRPFWPTLLLFAGASLVAVYLSAILAAVVLVQFVGPSHVGIQRARRLHRGAGLSGPSRLGSADHPLTSRNVVRG